jgi:hypothetical protein
MEEDVRGWRREEEAGKEGEGKRRREKHKRIRRSI